MELKKYKLIELMVLTLDRHLYLSEIIVQSTVNVKQVRLSLLKLKGRYYYYYY